MRFNRNDCPVCISNCHSGAITVADEIVIDPDKCTLCMVCVSECPADCFDITGGDFFGILARLRKMQTSVSSTVLGCKRASGSDMHERISCFGALSDEHLIALNTFMNRPVQLNLAACAQCNNYFVIDMLKDRIEDIRESVGITVSEKVILIENRADLRFETEAYDRRGFFRAVKNMAFMGASGFLEKNEDDVIQAYSQKRMPLKRNILNTTIKIITDKRITAGLLQEYAFTIKADASCDNCFSCIGLCPTGALKSRRYGSGSGLLFNPSLCIGCGLCRDFCLNNSIDIRQGYFGENYFEYETCNNDLCRPDAADAVCCHGQ